VIAKGKPIGTYALIGDYAPIGDREAVGLISRVGSAVYFYLYACAGCCRITADRKLSRN